MSSLAQKHRAINLSQGFPNFPSDPVLIDAVSRAMKEGQNQYAPMAGLSVLRQRLANKMGSAYEVELDPDREITITAGATQALFTAIGAFVQPGDEVIIFEPAYDSYRPAVEAFGGVVRNVRLEAPEYRIDWDDLSLLINSRTRMLLINSPHNPTGQILMADDLRRLELLLEGTDILVLSDEVYEHLVYDGLQHESVLRYPGLKERSLVTFSFGKTFHNTGWKVGYCVGSAELTAEFRKLHQFNVFSVNTPVQHALAEYLETPSHYLSLAGFYQHKRDFLLEAMRGSSLRPLPCSGTYFQLFDYSEVRDVADVEFAHWLTEHHGLASIPISAFYQGGHLGRIIRLCFAKTEDTLAEAARILQGL
jgi:methionine aminotransferase